ncbi:filament-like plant protein 7 [Dorcoceras hygrometricum]|uniref:Filament-like plant protein 7 n=1 Tax=Dorcoceras hygrometricum TaxID=472368 RepID=A0A2Z7AMI2_9LAMI|nr:filament-like plant protein 7 [Dorcoceras hygrometricum]
MFAQPVSKTQQSTAQQFARAVASDRPSMRVTSKQRPAISREAGGQLSAVAQRFARPPCGQRPAFDGQPVRNVLRKTAGHRAAIARPPGATSIRAIALIPLLGNCGGSGSRLSAAQRKFKFGAEDAIWLY